MATAKKPRVQIVCEIDDAGRLVPPTGTAPDVVISPAVAGAGENVGMRWDVTYAKDHAPAERLMPQGVTGICILLALARGV
jgi:hypothetical protein